MAAWQSSSLAFSDHNNLRKGPGLLKNMSTRISKQHMVEHKMFGSKRKNIQIGKKFKKVGKGIMKGSTSAHMDKMPSGVSPSMEEFDKMMNSAVKTNSSKKKGMFSRKSFG